VTIDDDAGKGSSLSFGPSGEAVIAYLYSGPLENYDDLMYATNIDGSWVTGTIDPGNVGSVISCAIDATGAIHVAYNDDATGKIKYATQSGSSWDYSIIDSSSGLASTLSLKLDSSGLVHVSYYDIDNKDLIYAVEGSGTWDIKKLYDSGNDESGCSLSLDGYGKAHILYIDGAEDSLFYITNSMSAWQ
jgi:hypothetical protein